MMPEINWLAILVAAIIPNVLGAIYYGPLFEKAWLSSLNRSKEDMVPSNMGLTYGLAFVMALIMSFFLKFSLELTHKDVNSAGELFYGSHHTFGHGALHGAMFALTMAVPVVVSLSLFQKNSGKNIMLNVIYWTLAFALMGGVLDAWT